jgi:hypothetical protein
MTATPDDRPEMDELVRPGALPPLPVRDLPESIPLRKMIGPSIMLAGLALGSGEFILWPYITFETRFVFFWACLLGVATQYFINMEITRWSLATGESATTGFARLSRHWVWIFLIFNVVPWIIPAWSTGAATVLSWMIWEPEADGSLTETGARAMVWMAVGGLVICGAILTAGKVVYETVERVQLVLVSLILILIVVLAALLLPGRGDAIVAQLQGAVNIGGLPEFGEQLTAVMLLGALAFAGAGGTLNLGQSNYVKDKGYGMGRYIGRITSPITGQEEAISEIGYQFPPDEANLARWKKWWRAASIEHFVSFFLTCAISLVLLTLICYVLFYDASGEKTESASNVGKNMSFIWGEAIEIQKRFSGAVKSLFLLMGAVILLTTEFGVLDASSRISADLVKTNWLSRNERWTESRLYYAFLWGTILLGSVLLLSVNDLKALTLFKLTAAMNGGVMFFYSITLLWMNRFRLRGAIRMSGWRMAIMIWSILFFGFFTGWAGWVVLGKVSAWLAG